MKTTHRVCFSDASSLSGIADESVQLIVTSPPYPMIEMWDPLFFAGNPAIRDAMDHDAPRQAFELMHQALDPVWREAYRVLSPGAMMCVNIGDAARTVNGNFQLYSSHSRIMGACLDLGFQNLPNILWRKTTNAPNKFMGSGMLPAGAYVTLEHEHILVFRKGAKRQFNTGDDKKNRRESAFFWEERNRWFSDVWLDLAGAGQALNHKDLRARSAAYPFELAYRLINMFSVKSDRVLDPFLGTGTTMLAAMASERNSIGFEMDGAFRELIDSQVAGAASLANDFIHERLANHIAFVKDRLEAGKPVKHRNEHYGFPCISKQEACLLLRDIDRINRQSETSFTVSYSPSLQEQFCRDWPDLHLSRETL